MAGKKGMIECQRRGAFVVALPRLELAAVDVVDADVSAKSYAAQAAMTAGWTAARAKQSRRMRFTKHVPDHAAFGFWRLRFSRAVHGQGGGEVHEPPGGHRS